MVQRHLQIPALNVSGNVFGTVLKFSINQEDTGILRVSFLEGPCQSLSAVLYQLFW